jgi:hypothetical protein
MLLSELRSYLTYGEMSQIEPISLPKLISHINLGVIELYKRFLVKTSEVVIQLADNLTDS